MPEEIVKNYVDHFMKFQNASKAAIALISYDNFDLRTTLDPNTLPSFFKQREFKSFKSESLFNKNRMNIYYISS